ncbi:MAG TPA: RNA polymerase sigma factor [Parvularculaceae bacterium]|nr:RNA polymerase sigma factor [Parvularculaceae bacterium]HRX39397.1 RNA polymerase sigma factor [Parvularculaceae bacterium]
MPVEENERSDAELMSEVAEGDHHAFTELMSRYKTPLFRFILRYVGSPSDAEDLLQDVFVNVYSKAATYDPAWKASTWIYRIALNKCRDHGRKQRLRRFFSIDRRDDDEDSHYVAEPTDPGASVESIVARRQELAKLTSAIEQLPHNLRSALVMHSIEGRSQTECAEILGVSRKSVEMLVYRARKALRAQLGED